MSLKPPSLSKSLTELRSPSQPQSRRNFLTSTAAVSSLAIPYILTPRRCRASSAVLGFGDYLYEYDHLWAQLPEKYSWQTTHNVAVDSSGLVYVIHEGHEDKKDHPSIFVFDDDGKFVRAFGAQFQGGGHGIEVRDEDGTEYLYVAAYQQVKSIAKLDLKGKVIWQKFAPMESGVYAKDEDTDPKKIWGRDRFMPTNFAFLPDGDFFLADGYGSFYIHRYDKDGNWISKFGGPGDGAGTFNTPHGLWIDTRSSEEPTIVITDRAHNSLQVFDLEGNYKSTVKDFGLPANIDLKDDLLLVPELLGRVSLLDRHYKKLVTLGDDFDRISQDSKHEIRRDKSKWNTKKFVHPHDACFDHNGNILVAEWVSTGRVSKLKRIK